MSQPSKIVNLAVLMAFSVIGLIQVGGWLTAKISAQEKSKSNDKSKISNDRLMPDTAAAYDSDWERPYQQYQPVGKALLPFPSLA